MVETNERNLRVAVIGSGPAGFYAARHLLTHKAPAVEVDVYDRLPTPYGLVRGGVAPDHQKIKRVTRVYDKTAAMDGFRFFGNVIFGKDIGLDELQRHYDHVVLAVGNEADRRLGIPGEGTRRSTPGSVFVGWYNGHPDYRDHPVDLSVERAAVVGNGNMAIDVARILASDPAVLARTDISGDALVALRDSRVREVIVLGRRGPLQAAFTPAELKELGLLRGTDVLVDPDDVEGPGESRGQGQWATDANVRNMKLLREFAGQERSAERSIRFRFKVSPEAVLSDASGAVSGLRLRHNELVAGTGGRVRARPTERVEELDVGLVITAVGYSGRPLNGIPFDPDKGRIRNVDGQVVTDRGEPLNGVWVVGWARSGPQGLIGAHRAASKEVTDRLLAHVASEGLPARTLPSRHVINGHLRRRGVAYVTFEDWQRLDAIEVERGERREAIRDKVTRVDEMLDLMGTAAELDD